MPFVLFDASLYQQETHRGTATGQLYLLDDEAIRYGIVTRDSALAPAIARETAAGGTLVRADEHIQCQGCQKVFALRDVECPPSGAPVEVPAICLPSD